MTQISHVPCAATLLAIGAVSMFAGTSYPAMAANHERAHAGPPHRIRPNPNPRLDFSGQRRTGIASFYAAYFAGRRMASGLRMNPRGSNAASRTLPLGTIARVTNLRTHRSAVVIIQDRGPYVQGRIVDLSPSTARKIGITRRMGIAKVRVTPIAIPPRDGRLRTASQDSRGHRRVGRRRDQLTVALGQQSQKVE